MVAIVKTFEVEVSQALVDHLKLEVRKPYRSYFVRWLVTGEEVQVRYACPVTFAIGENYKDTVWCDVLPMDSGDILLGRPWMYDKYDTHGMRDNKYTFMHSGKQVTLHPLKPEPPMKGSRARLTKEAFQVHIVYRSNTKNYRV